MKIFISYRRMDSRSFTERISDRLAESFGYDSIFQDVDNILAGEDFRQVLRNAVAECDAVLVIIGRSWLSVENESGAARLDDPDDFVRIEVESALSMGKLVIPVIVDNADPPSAGVLPSTLRELAFRNAAFVRYNPDFSRDMLRLIERLNTYEQQVEAARQEAARLAREEEERRAEAARLEREEQQRQEAAARAAREQEEQRVFREREAEAAQAAEEERKESARKAQQAYEEQSRRLQEEAQRPAPALVNDLLPLVPSIIEPPVIESSPVEEPVLPVSRPAPAGIGRYVIQAAAVGFTLLALFPCYFTLIVSLKTPEDIFTSSSSLIPVLGFSPSFVNWEQLFASGQGSAVGNSLIIGVVATLIAVSLGVFAGYGLARVRYRFGNYPFLVWLLVQRILPPIATALPLLMLARNFNLLNTLAGPIVTGATLALPYAVLIMRDYFDALPRDLHDSAEADGASYLQIMRRVMLPNARPALIAAALVCFIVAWNDFVFPTVFNPSVLTVTTALVRQQGQVSDLPGLVAAFAVLVMIPPVLLSLFVRRYVFNAFSLGMVE